MIDNLVSTISHSKAIVFDFDDTLIATSAKRRPLFWRFIQLIADPPAGTLDEVWGKPMEEMISRLAPKVNVTRALEAYIAIMELNPPVPLLPGAELAIRCLSDNGIPLMILTSSTRRLVESDLSRHNLLQYFEAIWSSDEMPWAKPDVRVISPLIKWLKERGYFIYETIMIGDSLIDLELANKAEMPFLAVTSGATNRTEFITAGCPNIINSLEIVANTLCSDPKLTK